jgi:RNA polymerase sigma factor (sigma-70 family)
MSSLFFFQLGPAVAESLETAPSVSRPSLHEAPGWARRRELTRQEIAHVYQRYAHLIRRWALRFFRDPIVADDMLNEVMLSIMKNGAVLLQLEHEGSRRQWLRTTTVRACLQTRRKQQREHVISGQVEAALATQHSAPMEERDLLEALLARLEPEERILAVLHFEDGMTKMEISELTQRSRPFIDKKLKHIAELLAALSEERTRDASVTP